MRLSRSLLLVSMLSVLNACGSVETADSARSGGDPSCVGPGCQATSGSKTDYDLAVDFGVGGATSAASATTVPAAVTVCGAFSVGCNPDLRGSDACQHVVVTNTGGTGAVPSAGSGGTATVGTAMGGTATVGTATVGTGGSGGSGGASVAIDSGFGGSLVAGSSPAAAGAGGAAAAEPGSVAAAASNTGDTLELACRLVVVNDIPMTTCEEAGRGKESDPCASRDDCGAGLACVEETAGSRCRQYCCGGNAVCSTGTACEERDLVDSANTENQPRSKSRAPVCMPAVPCRLDEPYPCPADMSCTCPAGKACSVVRGDGAPVCVTPGTGQDGDACPCAAGYVCSETLGQCFKACSLVSIDSALQCTTGVCQSSPDLPKDFGICVSAESLL